MRRAGVAILALCATLLVTGVGRAGHTVSITSGPPGETSSTTATFGWTSSASASFTCQLDSGPITACGSGTSGTVTYSGLAVGQHLFVVRATIPRQTHVDSDRTQWTVVTPAPTPSPTATATATASATAGPSPSPGPEPTAAPGPSRGTINTEAFVEPVVRGIEVRPRDLFERNLRKFPTPAKEVLSGEHAGGKFIPVDRPVLCGAPDPCAERSDGRSPKPTSPVRVLEGVSIDPQIAASQTHLIVTNYNTVSFLGKDGLPLRNAVTGEQLPKAMWLGELFHDLLDPGPNSINRGLNLPEGLRCDQGVNAYDVPEADKASVADCLMDIYDARAAFDSYRKRFVVIALIRNRSFGPTYMNPEEFPDAQQRVGRRTRVLIAYSKTQDPRDGWDLSWVNGEWGFAECNDIGTEKVDVVPRCPQGHLRPGDAVDYPLLGVSPQGIQLSLNIVHRNAWNVQTDAQGKPVIPVDNSLSYTRLVSIPAGSLINGTGKKAAGGSSWNNFSVPFPEGPEKVGLYFGTGPVRQHAPSDFGSAYWLTPFANRSQVVLFEQREGAPYDALDYTALPVSSFGTPTQGTPFVGFSLTVHTAVQRLGDIFASFNTCRVWADDPTGDCTSAIRVIRFPLATAPDGVVQWDRTFGRQNAFDDPPVGRDYVPYGYPAVDVTPLSDAVISYNRADTDLPTEARYSVWSNFDTDLQPGRLFKKGTGSCIDVRIDDATSAAEPPPSFARGEEAGVWLYNYFSKDVGLDQDGNPICGTTYAVTKVLGRSAADLGYRGVRHGGGSRFVVFFENNGDKTSAKTRARWSIARKGPDLRGTFRLPALASGRSRAIRFDAGRRLRPGRYRVKVRTRSRGQEYSTANNVVTDIVKIGA